MLQNTYRGQLSYAKSPSLSASIFQIPSLKIGTILNPNVFISRTKFITLYISVICAMEAPSILLDNSLTGFVISGLLYLVRYNNVLTPDLYMDCVFSFTFEISSTFPPINPGVAGVRVIFLLCNSLSKLFLKTLNNCWLSQPGFLAIITLHNMNT